MTTEICTSQTITESVVCYGVTVKVNKW